MGLPCEHYDSDCEVKPHDMEGNDLHKWADVFWFYWWIWTIICLLNQQGCLMFPDEFTPEVFAAKVISDHKDGDQSLSVHFNVSD